jgi:mRNA interferase MazF
MRVQQKEIVLLPYPFSNLEERKFRPAVVVSSNSFNKCSQDCIAVPMTSVLKKEPFSIPIRETDLAKGRLIKPSRIRVDKIFSVEKELVKVKIGLLNDFIFEDIRKFLLDLF